jgi:hypothetical protein
VRGLGGSHNKRGHKTCAALCPMGSGVASWVTSSLETGVAAALRPKLLRTLPS